MFYKHNLELIARVLLMPFIDSSFNDNDLLITYIKEYYNLDGGREEYRDDTIKAYRTAKKEIWSYVSKNVQVQHFDDVQMLLNLFYPVNVMSEKYDGKEENIYDAYLEKIYVIASNFITFRNGIVSIRIEPDGKYEDVFAGYKIMNKIELWNTISRVIPTDIFIAAHYINLNIIDEDKMEEYYVDVPLLVNLCDIPVKKIMDMGLAETHMHFNAGVTYLFSWQKMMSLEYNKANRYEYFGDAIFRYVFAKHIESNSNERFDQMLIKYAAEHTSEIKEPEAILYYILNNKNISYRELAENCISVLDDARSRVENSSGGLSEQKTYKDWLERDIYKKYLGMNTNAELIFLFKCLAYFKKNPIGQRDYLAKELFIKYLRSKSKFYADKLQSNKIGGLDYFSNHYSNSVRNTGSDLEERYVASFAEQCRNTSLKKIEVRQNAAVGRIVVNNSNGLMERKRKIKEHVQLILKSYLKYVKEYRNHLQGSDTVSGIGIIFHFAKHLGTDNFCGKKCIIMHQEKNGTDSNDYYSMRLLYTNFIEALNQLLLEYPLFSKYIVGLDAASKENEAEPWVFAPVFKNARIREYTVPINPQTRKRIDNLGFTYHVGEDFRHIVSGLRHIDEVIENFGYMSGDRIGHAVALGADIRKIVGVNKIICMPIIENLENMLWIWGLLNDMGDQTYLSSLEYRILKTARDIYKEDFGNINVYMLREAYDKKFKSITDRQKKIIECCHSNIANSKNGIEGFCLKALNEKSNELWDSDLLMCTHFCPCYFRRYYRTVFVEITEEDVDVIEKLQKILIKKIEQKGIYIETNPTSNVAITDIDRVMNHPILRLNNYGIADDSKMENSVLVTVNSDDPTVFATNVENELAIIYHSLVHYGYSREKVLLWINKIREHGINSSFVPGELTIEELERDISEIERINI